MRPVCNIKRRNTIQADKDIYELKLKTLNRLILTALKRKEAKRINGSVTIANITDDNYNLN